MNSQVADLVGDRDGGRASTPRSHPYPFPLPRITTAAKKPLTVEEADSFTSSCAGMTEERKATVSPNAIALPPNVRPNVPHDVDHCPACGSGELDVRPAVVSPFFAEYLFGGQGGLCGIAQCRNCTLMFFSRRLDRGEVARLYGGYRGEEYFHARHKHEFWYTCAFNDRLGEEADIRGRRELLYAAIGRHRDLGSIGSALDYGGDRGQILAQGPGRRRYVFDVSGAEPVEGVKRLRDEAELAGLDVDLLLLCEVLEHASAPA